MTTELVTFGASDRIGYVIETLLARRISGAPVVDQRRRLIGMISEGDCMRLLVSDAYDGEGRGAQRTVRELMSKATTVVEPDADVYRIAQVFVTEKRRQVPVCDQGVVIGQVSRRDVLRTMRDLL